MGKRFTVGALGERNCREIAQRYDVDNSKEVSRVLHVVLHEVSSSHDMPAMTIHGQQAARAVHVRVIPFDACGIYVVLEQTQKGSDCPGDPALAQLASPHLAQL